MAKPKNRAQKLSIDNHMMGPEPQPFAATETGYDTQLAAALRWYGYFYTQDHAKVWMLKYVKTNYSKQVYDAVKAAPTWKTSMTAAIMVHLLEKGTILSDRNYDFIQQRVMENAKWTNVVSDDDEAPPAPKVNNPHARLARKIDGQLSEIESALDLAVFEGHSFSFYTWATAVQASPQLINRVVEKYSPVVKEIEAEEPLSKGLKVELDVLATMLSDAERLRTNKSTTRRVRKPAPMSSEKLIKGLKFKKDDTQLKLVSIAPQEILGAKQLWVFSTKYNAIGVYTAADEVVGLRIKGASITEFDNTKSSTKKVRNPEKVLGEFMKAKNPQKFMDDIQTKAFPISARLGPDWILLKVKK